MSDPEDDLAIFTETEEQSMAIAAATRAARTGDVTLTRPVTEADEKWIRVLRAGWVAEP